MARATATTVTTADDLLARLPPERRAEMERVRAMLRRRLPPGYEETVSGGMIAYVVPLSVYPDTYNKQPLWLAALASQKNYLTLHLMTVYGSRALAQRLRDGFAAAGKRLDMGKACIRYKSADDLALDTIGEIVARVSVDEYVAIAKAARSK